MRARLLAALGALAALLLVASPVFAVTGVAVSCSSEPLAGSGWTCAKAHDGATGVTDTGAWALYPSGYTGQYVQLSFTSQYVSAVVVYPHAYSGAAATQPAFTVTASDGFSASHAGLTGTAAVTIDLGGSRLLTWARVTFTSEASGGSAGWREVDLVDGTAPTATPTAAPTDTPAPAIASCPEGGCLVQLSDVDRELAKLGIFSLVVVGAPVGFATIGLLVASVRRG